MPDVSVIFSDGTVTGEETGLGDVDKRLSLPPLSVFIIPQHGLLDRTKGFQIKQGHEPVFVHEVVPDIIEQSGIAALEHFITCDEVNASADGL